MDAYTNQTRKKWLILTFIISFFPLILPIISYGITKNSVLEVNAKVPPELFASLIQSILFSYLIIYCAYKKFGTRYLTFNIAMFPLYFLTIFPWNLYIIFKTGEEMPLLSKLISSGEQLCTAFFYLYWFLTSIQLRKINKEIQCRLVMSNPEYQEGINLFRHATDLNDLNEKFYVLASKHPGQLVVALDKVYQERKLFFEQQSSLVD